MTIAAVVDHQSNTEYHNVQSSHLHLVRGYHHIEEMKGRELDPMPTLVQAQDGDNNITLLSKKWQ